MGFAQDGVPLHDAYELGVWSGGGYSVPGGTANTGIFAAGVRFGWVISQPHLPGILHGRFEYAVDGVPLYIITQRIHNAYGAGFNALGLKWNFERRGRFSPYLELGGGVIFTNHNVPTYTNTVNFTPSAALGTHILGKKYNLSVEARYLHISSAGLAEPNPGLNTFDVRVGFGRFWHGKE
jgi:hypothetical protein